MNDAAREGWRMEREEDLQGKKREVKEVARAEGRGEEGKQEQAPRDRRGRL